MFGPAVRCKRNAEKTEVIPSHTVADLSRVGVRQPLLALVGMFGLAPPATGDAGQLVCERDCQNIAVQPLLRRLDRRLETLLPQHSGTAITEANDWNVFLLISIPITKYRNCAAAGMA